MKQVVNSGAEIQAGVQITHEEIALVVSRYLERQALDGYGRLAEGIAQEVMNHLGSKFQDGYSDPD